MTFKKFTHTLLKHHQASRRPDMTFKKFTHTLLKHHQASRRPSMECTKCEKDFGFAVNFVKSSKSKILHGVHGT